MNPPLRHKSVRATQNIRSFFAAAALIVGMVGIHTSTYAMRMPEARASLKGLTEAVDFGDSVRDRLVKAGLETIGTPYAWGGDDPDGFDCSGLVTFVYRDIAGLELPRRARDQRSKGKSVKRTQLEPGDLVFFATTRRRNVVSHVGIYIGDNQFVHAPSRGSKVRVDNLDDTYWSKRFSGARAYLSPEQIEGTATLVAHNDQ